MSFAPLPVISSTEEITGRASDRMPEEFFEAVAHHLPPEQPVDPKGGRPRIDLETLELEPVLQEL